MIKKITKNDLLKKLSNERFEELDLKIKNLIPKLNGVFPVSEKDLFDIVEEELPLKYLDVKEIRNITGLFKNKTITEDLSLWDTRNFECLRETFYNATIKSDISMWNTRNVRDLSYAFYYAKVESDLSQWETYNLETLEAAFIGITNDFGFSKWDIKNVRNLNYALYAARIEDLDLSAWNTHNVRFMNCLLSYYGCERIIENEEEEDYFFEKIEGKSFKVNISTWNTKNLDEASNFLYYSEAQVDISKWNVSNLRLADRMFSNYKLINFELKEFNLKKLVVSSYMFYNSNIKEDLSSWKLNSISEMSYMFGKTEYSFDIENMLTDLKQDKKELSSVGVVFKNNNYKHLTSKRTKFYIGNNNFTEEDLIEKTYEERIKLGLPIKIKKDNSGEILNFTEDNKIIYSKLKLKEDMKKEISEKGLSSIYSIETNNVEENIKDFEEINAESKFYFISGRCESYNQNKYESYYDFDRICILYLLKGDRLETISAYTEETEKTFDREDIFYLGFPFIRDLCEINGYVIEEDLSFLEIEKGRGLEEAKSNVKKTLFQKTIIFLNKLLVNG